MTGKKILSIGINDLSNPRDGLPMYLRDFDSEFSKDNQLVHFQLMTGGSTGEPKTEKLDSGSKVLYVFTPEVFRDKNQLYGYKEVLSLFFKLASAVKPDVIFIHDCVGVPPIFYSDFSSIDLTNTKVIYMVHILHKAYQEYVRQPVLQNLLDSEAVGLDEVVSDYIIANSPQTEEDVNKFYPETERRSYYVSLGVDKEKYEFSPNLDSTIILYFGRLDPQKGTGQMLESFRSNKGILEENNLEFWVAGDGGFLGDIYRMDMNGELKYLKSLGDEEKIKVLKQAKYALFPSLYEPYGLALNEALSMGKICIATPTGGHLDQITDKKNGFLLPEGDLDIFGKVIKIETELSNRKLKRVVNNARSMAGDKNTHFKIMRRLLDEIV